MKTRVFSVRLSYSTIVYCYKLQELAGRSVVGRPVGTIVSDTLEALVEASRKMYRIEDVVSDQAAELLLSQYADRIPGFEAVEPEWKSEPKVISVAEVMKRVEVLQQQLREPAGGEKTRPAEPSDTQRPEVKGNDDTGENVPDGKWSPGWDERSNYGKGVDVESALEAAALDEVAKDEAVLREKVGVGVVERVSPDVQPATVPKCPWEFQPQISEDEVKDEPLYIEAMKISPLYGIAIRLVFLMFPKDKWNDDKTINLAKKTYKDFKEWEEKYGPH